MKHTAKDYVKKFSVWLLSDLNGSREGVDEETEALRRLMRKEFIQLRDKGLSIRIVSV